MRFDESSATWVFVQQGVSRLLVAFKFFLLARLLGPESIGLIAAALMALSIAESLTEMGLTHALIQQRQVLDQRGLDALWTANAIRGALLSAVLFASAAPVAKFMGIPESKTLLQLVALVPFARCMTSMRVAIAQRERRFRTVSMLTMGFVVADFAMSSVAALAYHDVFWVLAAMPVSEFLKAVASHVIFSSRPRLNFDTSPLGGVMGFGRWIWASSLLIMVVNQLDRLIIVKTFGAQALGLYQTTSRLAQIGVADFGTALNQYLFPNFAELARKDKQHAVRYALALFSHLGAIGLVLATYFCVAAPEIVDLALGSKWSAAVPFFRIFVYLMVASVLAGMLNAYLRGTGRPSRVAIATLAQLIVLAALSAIAVPLIGAIGVALASAVSVYVCCAIMLRELIVDASNEIRQLRPIATIGFSISTAVALFGYVLPNHPYRIILLGLLTVLSIILPMRKLRSSFILPA
ncbi:TPA: oligosaccharide flippase family protein [Burkholderia vietnamiensis]|uniref:oligosaccharide flippase family protein n=1 Tax=Burkholderia TaxID=32008 RepID=UPI00158B766C|nr:MULTISPECIES: oligosaccharide flippase family protein [Burkholderia]MBR8002631.1 oligosaccharide flippase family protein [Burkholderia vietnamiensis]MCA7944723.1 oligosaccharide flippase family protein [Burkholderia vietnamiensis]MCA8014686.1 oligosaccharide flippase family protein [Burkholderia vietnamiensis]MCA8211698.1 oligosaccharide flippase family protein [Burkholderia vietnamiensis]QMI49385.1 oligosaccharide flippase family protein [Burkholderia sp. MBR-1]